MHTFQSQREQGSTFRIGYDEQIVEGSGGQGTFHLLPVAGGWGYHVGWASY